VTPSSVKTMPGSITIRLAIALAVVMGFLVMMEQSVHWQRLLEPVNAGLAHATEIVLRHMQMPVARHGTVLAHPDGFSYRITYVCAGIRPALLILITLLVMPASWTSRIAGMCVAVAGIEILNLLRLVHLYWTGVTDPNAFQMAHRVTWNIVAVIAVLVFLAVWLGISGERRLSKARIS
jgi:exosortase/archaeosortase family protein